jgi:transcriptional accessory protein Tex/SPT6
MSAFITNNFDLEVPIHFISRTELTKTAERESVQVFSKNLRRLLLTPPVTGCNVLAIDPGFKHGCKIAVVNENGKRKITVQMFKYQTKY